jgi:hypothetical protein
MNWEALGAIGEIVGALAVVLTLAYLATQVRYAKQATADQNRLTRASGVREIALAAATNDNLRRSMDRDLGFDLYHEKVAAELGIDIDDVSRSDWANGYWFWLHWGQFTSTHNDADRKEIEHLIEVFYTLPGVRRSWDNSPLARPHLDPEYQKFVDDIIARVDKRNGT